MKKIGIKLTLAIVSLIIVVCGALATSSYLLSAKALTLQVEENLQSKATDVSLYIEEVFNRMFVEIQSATDFFYATVCTVTNDGMRNGIVYVYFQRLLL